MSLKIPLHSYLDFSPANVTDVSDEHGEKVYHHNISTMGKHGLGGTESEHAGDYCWQLYRETPEIHTTKSLEYF